MKQFEIDALNFEVKAIENFLHIPFEGESLEEKQAFVLKHRSQRLNVTSELLHNAYVKHVQNEAKTMNVYAMNSENYVLHQTWDEALAYYIKLVGQQTFDEQKDDTTGDEINPANLNVRLETAHGEIRGTIESFIDNGTIRGAEYFAFA